MQRCSATPFAEHQSDNGELRLIYRLYDNYEAERERMSQLIVRIDESTKRKVSALAKREGKTVSEVVRGLLEDYVSDRDAGAYIDALWSRIGQEINTPGRPSRSIRAAVRAVRAAKKRSA